MPEFKTTRSLYRTRTVRSITRTMQPIASKYLIDFRAEEVDSSNRRKSKVATQRNSFRTADTVLDRIIGKLKRDFKPEDILLLITPASTHAKRYKLHVIERHRQGHLGMTTITHNELSRWKASKAFQKYCLVFGSRYIDLKTVVLQTETIKSLVNILNRKCCVEAKDLQLPAKISNTSSAGDYFNAETVHSIKLQDSFIQTDPEIADNIAFSLKDILQLIDTINQTLEPCKNDIERFFLMADKMKFSLVVRPELLWKSNTLALNTTQENCDLFQIESYLPGNCYLGCITMLENDLMHYMDLFPKLLYHIHVIEDVFELTPLPRFLVELLKIIFGFLKLELLYDALGELIFEWYKNFTYL
ncbi:uncharacterized protein LOC119607316 [Lucilia sericata]|uniref:uncharacterized protein LOC119607316 n=1 Tax=Lucilia sericata TaxID=13632 RepID=UPI0018A87BA7|nr:uncharacterized protein LOC119607316 [Lucilia sericata]